MGVRRKKQPAYVTELHTGARAKRQIADEARGKPKAPAKARHKWDGANRYAKVGAVSTCENCGLKSKLIMREKKAGNTRWGSQTLAEAYLMDGKWVELKSPPPCGKASKPCPSCKGTGVVNEDPLAAVRKILHDADPEGWAQDPNDIIVKLRAALPKAPK